MATHHLAVDQQSIHGSFDRDRKPALHILSGDTVVFQTLDANWGREGRALFGVPEPDLGLTPEQQRGHALTGPVAVRGAQPGSTLAVHIVTVRPGTWGHSFGGGQPRFRTDDQVRIGWNLDPDAMIATDTSGLGLSVPLRPFMGVMGNAPASDGPHVTTPPRRVGGNIDCRELVPGSTLYLPVEVEGALFSVGDGHGVQGDGEISITSIECPMERVELRFDIRNDLTIDMPFAETPAGYITFGFADTLDKAMPVAVNAMLDHVQQITGFDRPVALSLASLVVDLRITQVVNGVVGVHAVLPQDAFSQVSV